MIELPTKMTVTSRLWRILRSRLGARRPDDRMPPLRDAPSASRDRAGAKEHRDPVLARYYANLEVPYGSDLETVERAWKRLMRRYHPDVHASDPERQRIADDLVKQLNRAYAELRRRLG